MTDLGRHDVVERVGGVPHRWRAGERATVVSVLPISPFRCDTCGQRVAQGLILTPDRRLPIDKQRGLAWCPNHWRKIGPGRDEVARMFAEDLSPAKPKVSA